MKETNGSSQELAPLNPQLEKDLLIVRRIVSIAMAALLVLVAGFVYNIIVGDGLTFVRPSDELVESEQAYRNLINVPSEYSGEGVNVCIVDTGMELNHPDLEGFDVAGWIDVVQGKSNPYDDNGHGTSMAGILVANGWINGVAKNAVSYTHLTLPTKRIV